MKNDFFPFPDFLPPEAHCLTKNTCGSGQISTLALGKLQDIRKDMHDS